MGLTGLWIALVIVGAELLYGVVKYTTAPTPEARREGVQELQSLVYGAVFTIIMWYYVDNAPTIANQLAGALGLGGYMPASVDAGLKTVYNEELGPLGLVWEYALIYAMLGVASVLPYAHTFSAILNNYFRFFMDALEYTIMNGIALYAIGLFLKYSLALGIVPLMTTLLIPARTRPIAAGFIATYLVLSITWPVLVAVFNMVYVNYAQLLLTWLNSLTTCQEVQWLQQWLPWLSHLNNPIMEGILCFFLRGAVAEFYTQTIKGLFMINYYAFWMIVYDALMDVAIAIAMYVIWWLAGLIEEGAGALFTIGKIG